MYQLLRPSAKHWSELWNWIEMNYLYIIPMRRAHIVQQFSLMQYLFKKGFTDLGYFHK